MGLTPINFFGGISIANATGDKFDRGRRFAIRRQMSGEQRRLLEHFDYDYFESDLGYGGYHYDGRYGSVTEQMIRYYGLEPGTRTLDVGCAKGYFVYEFQKRLGRDNQPVAFGCDISEYALNNGKSEVKAQLSRMSAHQLAFPDGEFDLVTSVDTIHNLPEVSADAAICEMMRVSRGKCFVQVASYSTRTEEEALRLWGATVKTFRSCAQWLQCFDRLGYKGEYWLKTFTFLDEIVVGDRS